MARAKEADAEKERRLKAEMEETARKLASTGGKSRGTGNDKEAALKDEMMRRAGPSLMKLKGKKALGF